MLSCMFSVYIRIKIRIVLENKLGQLDRSDSLKKAGQGSGIAKEHKQRNRESN